MNQRILWYGLLLLCLNCSTTVAADQAAKQAKLQKQYEDTLKSLKDDDEAGYIKLAKWCQTNHMTKESDHAWELLLGKKRAKLAESPSMAGYQALIKWCTQQGLKQFIDDVTHDMMVFDYKQRKEKLAPDDVKGLQELAKWCQTNKLISEAIDVWNAVLKLEPDNAQAKTQMETFRSVIWAEAPVGLLKNQKVPGYTQETAWYDISVPKDYKDKEYKTSGMPLIIFLHGGQHNAGTAENVVALAQVIPAFKKVIVLFPNHLKTWWYHPRELTYLVETLMEVQQKWHIDPRRIYLMGASMGGNGTWGFGSQCPELFAALAPMSGFYADFLEFPMKNLVDKPIYILHGTQDTTVPIDGARLAFNLLKNEGSKTITMTEPACGHQLPNDEIGKAAEWILQYTNKQDFDLKVLKERVEKLPVAGWLKQYEGN